MQKRKLLDDVREILRIKNYSYRTEKSYIRWIRKFILFHQKRHPQNMAEPEIKQFLNYLADNQKVAASTQNQALNAILFLYKKVLQKEIGFVQDILWAKKPVRVPVVLTSDEAMRVLRLLEGKYRLAASLMYGSGLRLLECLRLRCRFRVSSAHRTGWQRSERPQDHAAGQNGQSFKGAFAAEKDYA